MPTGLIPPTQPAPMGYAGDPTLNPAGTGTQTPTNTTPSVDVTQLYAEWAASNPNADPAAAFAAGMDAALSTDSPIGLGQMDEFEELSPFDQVVNVEDQVDTFPELQPQVDTFGEGTINKGSWRDTVIDVSNVQPGGPQGG